MIGLRGMLWHCGEIDLEPEGVIGGDYMGRERDTMTWAGCQGDAPMFYQAKSQKIFEDRPI
jgi:hypothetical protein